MKPLKLRLTDQLLRVHYNQEAAAHQIRFGHLNHDPLQNSKSGYSLIQIYLHRQTLQNPFCLLLKNPLFYHILFKTGTHHKHIISNGKIFN